MTNPSKTPQEVLYHYFIDRATDEELDEYGYIGLGDGQAEGVLKELRDAGYAIVSKADIQEWLTISTACSVVHEYPVKHVTDGSFIPFGEYPPRYGRMKRITIADWLRSLLKQGDT